MGLYLYSTGATRQQISVMNHLGLSVSYITLARQGNKAQNLLTSKTDLGSESSIGINSVLAFFKTCSHNWLGTLEAPSESMRKATQKVAVMNMYELVYDNINMLWKVAEQILGCTGLFLYL